MGYTAKDLIDATNVVETYQRGKYTCFVLTNGITVKLDPNQDSDNCEGGENTNKKKRRIK